MESGVHSFLMIKASCKPSPIEDGVTALQAAKVFVLYMENHPEEENKPRQVALMHAMLNAGLVSLGSPGKDKGK